MRSDARSIKEADGTQLLWVVEFLSQKREKEEFPEESFWGFSRGMQILSAHIFTSVQTGTEGLRAFKFA